MKYTVIIEKGRESGYVAYAPALKGCVSQGRTKAEAQKNLKEAMEAMRRVIEGVGWVPWGDVRANVIEPHLGYSLRKLETDLQPGTGMGHGLIGIYEIRK